MRNIFLMATAFAALTAASAQAADLPRRKTAPEPYYNAAPTFTWTGFYLGANAGYGFGKFTGAGRTFFGEANNGFVGLTGGYNYQANNIVLGVEADFDWTNMKDRKAVLVGGTNVVDSSARISSFGTVRGRLGYAMDRALIFATAGVAGANMKAATIITDATPAVVYSGSGDTFHTGYALGAGLEYAFTNNVSAKGEYVYANLSKKDYFSAPNQISSGASLNLLRAGVNYRF